MTALACVVVGVGISLAVGKSALVDWRAGRRERDATMMFIAVQVAWAALILGGAAIALPILVFLAD